MDERFAVTGVHALTPLSDAAPALLVAKAEPLFALESAAGSGADMDAVHDMRVASRRLRESMRLLQPLYPTDEYARWYRRVKRITRALGPVRDSDVFIDDFSSLAKDLGEGGRRAVAFMVGRRMGVRERELELLNRELARLDLGKNRRAFRRLAHGVGLSAEVKRPLADFAHAAVAERAAAVLGALPGALSEENVHEQHMLRIDFKRLRYAVEVFAPVYGDDFDKLHDTLTAFQDVLGDMHDLHIFLDMLRDPVLVGHARRAGVAAADIGEVVKILEVRAHKRFVSFVKLVAEHPAPELLAALLLPLSRRPEPTRDDTGEPGDSADSGGATISARAAEKPAAAVVLDPPTPVGSGRMPEIDPEAQPWKSDPAGFAFKLPVVIGAEPWAHPAPSIVRVKPRSAEPTAEELFAQPSVDSPIPLADERPAEPTTALADERPAPVGHPTPALDAHPASLGADSAESEESR